MIYVAIPLHLGPSPILGSLNKFDLCEGVWWYLLPSAFTLSSCFVRAMEDLENKGVNLFIWSNDFNSYIWPFVKETIELHHITIWKHRREQSLLLKILYILNMWTTSACVINVPPYLAVKNFLGLFKKKKKNGSRSLWWNQTVYMRNNTTYEVPKLTPLI